MGPKRKHRKSGPGKHQDGQAKSERKEKEISAVRQILPLLAKDLWPEAREQQRRWTAWLGPTNSGKTHSALRHLKEQGGSYLAPLRLLAQEVHELLESEGVPTSLRTGEERIERDGSCHTSATVEMGSTTRSSRCVVIDEIQMLADRERGHAWVRALLGSPSEHVMICGTPQSETALLKLAEYAGVTLDIHRTERKTPLSVAPHPIFSGSVPDASIVVAFSRMDVLTLARHFRDQGRPVATIYGAMPPELRRAESRRFRTGEARIMLATDAVGMGLNIPAEYVIFSTASKFDGISDRLLTPEEVLQIGGRAGRFGLHREGIVAGIDRQTHNAIRRQFNGAPPALSGPFPFMPDFPIVLSVSEVLGTSSLEILLSRLHASILTDDHLRSGIGPEVRQKASRIEQICPMLPLEERWLLLFSPVNRVTENEFWRWMAMISKPGRSGDRTTVRSPQLRPVVTRAEGEELLARLALYKWLSLRFSHRFPEMDQALEHYSRALEMTRLILEKEGRARKGRRTRNPSD